MVTGRVVFEIRTEFVNVIYPSCIIIIEGLNFIIIINLLRRVKENTPVCVFLRKYRMCRPAIE
jgi:hypothetical protein